MALIDYGAVVFKNGKQINHNMFMDMLSAVGWVDRPRRRYPDCDRVDKKGFSICDEDCPHINKETIHDDRYGDYSVVISDCKDNVFKSGNNIDGNYFVYVGDEHLTVAVYRHTGRIIEDKKIYHDFWGSEKYDANRWFEDWRHLSTRTNIAGVDFHFKSIVCGFVDSVGFTYKGNRYDIVYGYGIDPDMKTWNNVKNDYLGKYCAKKVDNLFRRIKESSKFYKRNE